MGLHAKRSKVRPYREIEIFGHCTCASIVTFTNRMFVWIDETGTDLKEMLRKYGYAIRGERAVCNRIQVRDDGSLQ